MGYEIDFLHVGDGEKSGDAIALRFGNLLGTPREQFVAVVDGGFRESGEQLVKHIRKYYQTDHVDLVVSTHPDSDHAAGLAVVLEEMQVDQLWMHKPWEHTDDMAKLFHDGRVTDHSISENLRKSLEDAWDLNRLAVRKKVPVLEPFTGVQDCTKCITVLGPSREYYENLLPDFRATLGPKTAISFLERALQTGKGLATRAFESLGIETLTDDGETSAENNSSVILRLLVDNRGLLFTGDAGIPALTQVADLLDKCGIDARGWAFIQVPHHGSKRNVGPTILNRLVGPILSEEGRIMSAFVSAAKQGAPKHPSKKVTNAFRRRGAPVCFTNGQTIWHSQDAPKREGWTRLEALPLYAEVDD